MEIGVFLSLLVKYGPDVVDEAMVLAANVTHVSLEQWNGLKAKIATSGESLIPQRFTVTVHPPSDVLSK